VARIGLLGGTFNPAHSGHLRLAVEALERLGLDRVELIPVGLPPHKGTRGLLAFDLRLRLCRAAVAGVVGLAVNPVEGERQGPSYTIDTLRLLEAERPGEELFFILGMGEFLALAEWKEGLRLPEYAHLVVAARAGSEMEPSEGKFGGLEKAHRFAARHWPGVKPGGPTRWTFPSGRGLLFLDVPRLDISASDLRARFLAGRRLRGLIPGAVERELDSMREAALAAWGLEDG
jgi:nicotinate-nucleotide adenylyltransferase